MAGFTVRLRQRAPLCFDSTLQLNVFRHAEFLSLDSSADVLSLFRFLFIDRRHAAVESFTLKICVESETMPAALSFFTRRNTLEGREQKARDKPTDRKWIYMSRKPLASIAVVLKFGLSSGILIHTA